jgi:N-acetylglucosaminyldiphosphoundecaprenol N-acetyl-beta-D-mannosaminyltransferase
MISDQTDTLSMFGMHFSSVTLPEATEEILDLVGAGKRAIIVTPNVDHIVTMEHDEEMRRVFENAHYRYADGMPLVWLSWMRYQQGLPARVTGADLLFSVAEGAARRNASIYLLGAQPGVAVKAADQLTTLYPGLNICGIHSPPFGFEQDDELSEKIVAAINGTEANILFIGVGTPKQEKWAYRWRDQLRCDVILGVGAAIDFAAGTTRRAPRIVQQSGLEWMWRIAGDPKRLLPRYYNDRKFFRIALRELGKGVRKAAKS